MTLTRRQSIALSAAGLMGLRQTNASAETIDGAGPNRGIVEQGWRGKQTCNNAQVPVSDAATRLSMPDDFLGEDCRMISDSHEGPYFTCAPAPGKDVTYGQAGQPLTVAMRLVDGNCQPIPGGVVDIWGCNATGHYSGYNYSPDEMPPMVRVILFGHIAPDMQARFCRGALRTDADGIAEFETIYPGFYYGQPIHLHFKAHVDGKNLVTSQANFSEAWNERVMQTAPYNAPRPIKRNAKETGFPRMRIIERGDRLVGVLDLVVPT